MYITAKQQINNSIYVLVIFKYVDQGRLKALCKMDEISCDTSVLSLGYVFINRKNNRGIWFA